LHDQPEPAALARIERPLRLVFTWISAGSVRHAYATEMMFAPSEPGQGHRHVDAIWPLWGMLDLSPEGRGPDTRPKLRSD
jgi:hypothetical protein